MSMGLARCPNIPALRDLSRSSSNAWALEHLLDHKLVEFVVFGHEHAQASEAPVGLLRCGQTRREVAGMGPAHGLEKACGHHRLGHDGVEVEIIAGGSGRAQLESGCHQHHQRQA